MDGKPFLQSVAEHDLIGFDRAVSLNTTGANRAGGEIRVEGGERNQNMTLKNSWTSKLALAVGTLGVVFAQSARAQVQTKTSIQSGQSSEVVRVDRGTVIAVEGNDLIVRMEDGSMRHFENIPQRAKVTVGGKQLGVQDLKPGMKLQRTITTTTTPQVVTTIETVKGKVWYIAAPSTVILTLENGTNQSFKIPNDQKFDVGGQMVDAFGVKKGMVITATKIVEVPMSVVSQERSVTGTMPAPPVAPEKVAASEEKSVTASEENSVTAPVPAPAQTPAGGAPLLIAEGAPTAAPPEGTEKPAPPAKTSPTMGGYLPLVGLGLLLITILAVARSVRSQSKS
jgi:hypothetical protein